MGLGFEVPGFVPEMHELRIENPSAADEAQDEKCGMYFAVFGFGEAAFLDTFAGSEVFDKIKHDQCDINE